MARRSAQRGRGFRVAASAVVLVATLGILEGVARLVAAPEIPEWRPAENADVVMTGNATRLWGMSEGVRQNGHASATINANGLRGDIPELPRPTGRQRILLVGDSSFFGHGIGDTETIGARLQATLQAQGIDVDVVNGAIPGYSTEQTRILLDEVGWDMQPTLLLIANLWSDNNADGFRDVDLLRTARVYQHNPLVHSALFQLIATSVDNARGGTAGHLVTWTKSSKWPAAKERRVPVQAYATNLDVMVRTAREHGAGAAFISPANQGLVTGEYKNGAGWDPYFAAQAAVAAWHKLPVASAVDALQADPAPVGDKFVDVMHPSALGANDIALEVAQVLTGAGWPAANLYGREEPFDASGVVDDSSVPPGGQSAKYSPQAQLFPDVWDEEGESADPDHNGAGQASPPTAQPWSITSPPKAPPTDPPPVATPDATDTPAPAVITWDVVGSVTGGKGPIQVAVRSADGRPMAFTSIPEPGPFSLHVRGTGDEVTVVATGSDGATGTVQAVRGAGEVVIGL